MAIGRKRTGTPFGAIPTDHGALARHEQLFELEDLIELCKHIEKNPTSPMDWEFRRRPASSKSQHTHIFFVSEFCFRVKRVLADIATPSACAALRWFSMIKFTKSKNAILPMNSRTPQAIIENQRTCAHLVGKVGRRLAQVRGINFFGKLPPVYRLSRLAKEAKRSGRKKTCTGAKAKMGILNLSITDRERYDRLGEEEIRTHANCVLWRQHKNTEKGHMKQATYHAFRESANRIRKCLVLPSSASLLKKR